MMAVVNNDAADVAAIADVNPDMLGTALDSAPGARGFESFDELLAADVDGIVIATPSALHAEQSIAALEAGKAVFCQKPLGRDHAETRAVVAAAERQDRLLGLDLSYRHTAFDKLYRLIQEGDLGEIYAVDLVFHNAYGPDKDWFYNPRLSGGGCLIDLGVHLVDLALWTLGFPRVTEVSSSLYCRGRRLSDPARQVEDYVCAKLETGGGATISLSCSWNLSAGRDAVIEAGFHGTRGGGRFRNLNGSFYDFTVERYHGTATTVLALPPDDWSGRALLAWTRELGESPAYSPRAAEFVAVAEIIDRIYQRT